GKIVYMGDCYPSCGYSGEVIHLYYMSDLVSGEQNLDSDEAIDLIEVPFEEAYEMAMNGELADSKTMSALLMARKY
ncbi:MAG: NUDIX hydrolase, partial [Bacillota bacterium]|nr:NUDIX hydrolase [Bacillota bacterium]